MRSRGRPWFGATLSLGELPKPELGPNSGIAETRGLLLQIGPESGAKKSIALRRAASRNEHARQATLGVGS